MQGSTIHSPCPQCKSTALVQHVGGTYRCAACDFDYGTLRTNDAAREAWMLTCLRGGPAEKLAVLFLHRLVMELPLADSNALVLAFAENHGVVMPTGKPMGPGLIVGVVIAAIVAVLILGFALGR
jgi:hypothetical protein